MSEPTSHLKGVPLILASFALCLASLLIVLDYSIANVSIPYIAGDLGVSANEGTYVITSFAIGTAIVLPLSSWLTKRFGIIRTFVVSLFGFIIFSWMCAVSVSLEMMVISRFIQGLFSGPMVPLSQTLMVMIFPKEKKSSALALWSTVVVTGPVIGPILGGWISYDFHWPWIFLINIPLGLFSLFVIKLMMQHYETVKEKISTDWIGLVLLAVGVSCLQFLLDKGEQYDWLNSTVIKTCGVVAIVCFVYLFVWEKFHKSPLIDLNIFKIKSFSLSVLIFSFNYVIYFGGIVLIPLWLQEYMGYTPLWAGLAVAPVGVMSIILSRFVGKLTDRKGPIFPLRISQLLMVVSSFLTCILFTDITFGYLSFTRYFYGLALTFLIVPSFILMAMDVPQEKLPSATGTFHFFRAMSGAIGTSVFTTLWIRRSAFHHANIVAQVVPNRPPVNQFYSLLTKLGFSNGQSEAFVNQLATNQAAVLGLNDIFYLSGWIFIVMLAILLIGKQRKPVAA